MNQFLKPKKSLGQNFLINNKVVADTVAAADLQLGDVVLEVGPGKGVLTEELLKTVGGDGKACPPHFAQQCGRVIAVEKDIELVNFLKGKFAREIKDGRLVLIHDDILDFYFGRYGLKIDKYKIVANIPYYITSHFVRRFLEGDPSTNSGQAIAIPPRVTQPSLMVLMVQKEVACRILGDSEFSISNNQFPINFQVSNFQKNKKTKQSGKESLLSISVKAYGEPEIVRIVPADNFFPKPEVDSAVLKISNISKDFFRLAARPPSEWIDEKKFFSVVKQGFSGKRKMLKNNLKISAEILQKLGISEKARAEDLSLEDWKKLFGILSTNLK